MRFPAFATRGAASTVLVLACLGGLPPAALAQDLPGGVQLGVSAQQLQETVPALRRVPRPAHLAGGLVGAWSGPPVEMAGVALTPTFFFADGQLRRIEYLASPARAGAFDALVAWGRAAWGPELASEAPEGAYATWTHDGIDAYLQRTGSAQRPQVRLVVKQRVVKDDSQL
jgi:hypothetical protein